MNAENLQRQLDEVEALRAMYPEEEGCFVLAHAEQQALETAAEAVEAAQRHQAANGCTEPLTDIYIPSISGTITLPGVLLAGNPVSLRFQLPADYPSTSAAQVMITCSAPRLLHEQLSAAMAQAAEDAIGSESLLLLLDRLQEEVANANAVSQQQHTHCAASSGPASTPAPAVLDKANYNICEASKASVNAHDVVTDVKGGGTTDSCRHELLRVVIWFHHIKNTQKRKDLVAWARELGIGGYSKPGFPGVVIAEGCSEHVREYVARIRALQWQAMQVRGEQRMKCRACRGIGSSSSGCSGQRAAGADSQLSGALPCRGFSDKFSELPESGMSELGQYCKAAGMEELFLAALKLPSK